MSSKPNLPRVDPWEIESTFYNTLTEFERAVVGRMMDSLIDIGRANDLNLWAMNPPPRQRDARKAVAVDS